MLFLSRKVNQSIKLEWMVDGKIEVIEVIVADLSRGKVKLGFKAPRTVTIFRSELEVGDAANDRIAPASVEREAGADPLCDPAGDVHHQAHAAG